MFDKEVVFVVVVVVVVVAAAHPQKRHNFQPVEGGFYIYGRRRRMIK